MRLNFSNCAVPLIEEGIARLARVLKDIRGLTLPRLSICHSTLLLVQIHLRVNAGPGINLSIAAASQTEGAALHLKKSKEL
jgi:hypothetical protein